MSTCKVEDCCSASRSLGFCEKHYKRFMRYGDPHAGKKNHAPLEERFWRNVEKTDGCWFWKGTKESNAYGIIQTGGKGAKSVTAHRLSYMMHHGEIPDGYVIMHSCDNPSCVNPDHLSVGTYQENAMDAISKGRHARVAPVGAGNGKAVLNDDKVRYIRASSGVSHVNLAKELGVSISCVRGVRSGRTWRHVK